MNRCLCLSMSVFLIALPVAGASGLPSSPQLFVGLATLRVDGFASLGASFDGGEFITSAWEIDGGQLVLNAKSDYGEICVELLDDEEQPLPGYSLEDCVPVTSDGLDLPVQWKDHQDLAGARGKTVRLRFQLKNARLYSYRGAATD